MLIKVQLNERKNLEVKIDVPPFIFKKFLRKNKNLDYNSLWEKLLENTELTFIEPEKIGALTNAPIIKWNQKYYWFSDYQVLNEFEKLENNEVVEFQLVS